MNVIDEVPVSPTARVYPEGWQSWSPTTWYSRHDQAHRPSDDAQRLMRFRPGTRLPEAGVQGEGLLVLDPGEGAPVRTYATSDASTKVPSITAEWHGERVVVRSNGAVAATLTEGTGQTALTQFGDRFGAARGARTAASVPRVWCTWYRYFEEVTAADVAENVREIERRELPVDVVQIDDGWSLGAGEWTRPNSRFGSIADAVSAIRDSGRRAGIWLAPFSVGRTSDLARTHPEWLTGPAGFNWGDDLVGLDLTHPGVRAYVADVFSALRDVGVEYLKLDFLYSGAVPAGRFDRDATPIAAYRSGLDLIREVMGPDTYLLGCGAPILPSVGLVDAMRVASDTFHEGGENGSQGLRGRMSLEARSWQDGRLWTTDPDCLVARPSFALREEWADVVLRAPGVRGFSDRISELDARGMELVRQLLKGGRA
ncbi:glycoside hydrolase family 36 protein [Microbacterium sp. zg.Y909]|uniref:glycoside hydrolase family 36 protein n=1 Tax=Microbacterium sp. zg.Y909 TaxID=2969413 RepID=UPI00214BFA3A|nr:glycoside hydrolase family 36 protein [Microbacterium sp. zg.Y909]MCR2825118.1 alpha-galactosidase [Microbacterium sp. zg.Y909]